MESTLESGVKVKDALKSPALWASGLVVVVGQFIGPFLSPTVAAAVSAVVVAMAAYRTEYRQHIEKPRKFNWRVAVPLMAGVFSLFVVGLQYKAGINIDPKTVTMVNGLIGVIGKFMNGPIDDLELTPNIQKG